ncbi:hypothetical protein LBMAG53_22070 [Planctomycetota bacterium]|nr:hypothetical protein LBMAG53_22070 [Planctomycetota bacterium]
MSDRQVLELAAARGLITKHDLEAISQRVAQADPPILINDLLVGEGFLTQRQWDGLRSQLGPLIGDLIAGYRLDQALGSGAMSEVFRATKVSTGQVVALKLLLPKRAANPVSVERFRQEAAITRSISHPRVAAILDAGAADGRHFLVMEYLPGRDAQRMLRKLPAHRIPTRRALQFARDCALALEAIHAAGVLHRDIKPANILIDQDGSAKLGDLGLALEMSATQNPAGTIVGTPAFLPPEAVMDGGYDARSDLYALGATLFTLLTGSLPYPGTNTAEVVKRIREDQAPDIRAWLPDLMPQVVAVVHRAMARDREQRHASAAALRGDLEDLLAFRIPRHTTQPIAPMAVARDRMATPTSPFQPVGEGAEVLDTQGGDAISITVGQTGQQPAVDDTASMFPVEAIKEHAQQLVAGSKRLWSSLTEPGQASYSARRRSPWRSLVAWVPTLLIAGAAVAVLIYGWKWLQTIKDRPVGAVSSSSGQAIQPAYANQPTRTAEPGTAQRIAPQVGTAVPNAARPADQRPQADASSNPKEAATTDAVPAHVGPTRTPLPFMPARIGTKRWQTQAPTWLERLRQGSAAPTWTIPDGLPPDISEGLTLLKQAVEGLPATIIANNASILEAAPKLDCAPDGLAMRQITAAGLTYGLPDGKLEVMVRWPKMTLADQVKLLASIEPKLEPADRLVLKRVQALIAEQPPTMPSDDVAMVVLAALQEGTQERPTARSDKPVQVVPAPSNPVRSLPSALVTVMASDSKGSELGTFPAGTELTLQYVSGEWSFNTGRAMYSPDVASQKITDTLIVAVQPNGEERVLGRIPPGSSATPYRIVTESEALITLRMSDDNFWDNSGSVVYRWQAKPQGKVLSGQDPATSPPTTQAEALLARFTKVAANAPSIISGTLQQNALIDGLAVFESGAAMQDGLTITVAPGSIVVMKKGTKLTFARTRSDAYPVMFLLEDSTFDWGHDWCRRNHKTWSKGIVISTPDFDHWNSQGVVLDQVLIVNPQGEFGPKYRIKYEDGVIANSVVVGAMTTASVIIHQRDTAWVHCGFDTRWGKFTVQTAEPITLFDIGDGYSTGLKNLQYSDERRYTIEQQRGQPQSVWFPIWKPMTDLVVRLRHKFIDGPAARSQPAVATPAGGRHGRPALPGYGRQPAYPAGQPKPAAPAP